MPSQPPYEGADLSLAEAELTLTLVAAFQVGLLATTEARFVEAQRYEQLVLFIPTATSPPVDASCAMKNAAVP